MSLFVHRSGMLAGLDPLTVAYAAASGATSLAGIDAIIRYARAESLLNNIRLYPMKSAQNAGTGTTVYGIGSLTANNMTLVNGPTWGAGGLAFVAASSQYGSIDDFLGSETITVFARVNKTDNTTAVTGIAAQYDTGANKRSFMLGQGGTTDGDPLQVWRSLNGGGASVEVYRADKTGIGADTCYAAQWIDGGGRSLWANKTLLALTLQTGSPQTSRFNSDSVFTFGAFMSSGTPSGFSEMTGTALAVVTGTITDTQRETLTDLINAL